MAIPDYQAVMLPMLELASDGAEHRARDAVETLAERFGLSAEERNQRLPSGGPVFRNRVGWARNYLKQAGLLDIPRRGVFRITERGRALLSERPASVDVSVLERFPEFVEFRNRRKPPTEEAQGKMESTAAQETPEELLATAYRSLREEVEAQLLDEIGQSSPAFFEQLVVDLLVAMGYGGTREDAGRAIGRSGDEGIDGIIDEDRLGLEVIYLQAKRWEGVVGRPEIQKFAGALQGQRARKGVFITTSRFSDEAREYARMIDSRIILLDGGELTKLMFEHGVGVSTTGTYEVKRVDSDYFSDE